MMGWGMRNKIEKAWRNRSNDMVIMGIVFIAAIVVLFFLLKNDKQQFFTQVVVMVSSAAISAIMTLYFVKRDIFENDINNKIFEFGIETIEDDFERIFQTEDGQKYLSASSWNAFFKSAANKEIVLVGHALETFLSDEKRKTFLLSLCLKGYQVSIIVAHPYSEEVILQSISEQRYNTKEMRRRILNTYHMMEKEIERLSNEYAQYIQDPTNVLYEEFKGITEDPKNILKKNFRFRFAYNLPKALIFKAGYKMIVTPYMLDGPHKKPTLIVKDATDSSFYDTYQRYIERIIKNSCDFQELLDGNVDEVIRTHYGIVDIKTGRNNLFDDDLRLVFDVTSWKEVFRKAKEIDVVGVSMYGFFNPAGLTTEVLDQANIGKKINIIWANPYSQEVEYQSIAELKPGKIKDHILLCREIFKTIFVDKPIEYQNRVSKNVRFYYSQTIPKAFIVRVDDMMFYTPYFLSGPYEEPIYTLKKCDDIDSIYGRLNKYIEDLKKLSVDFKTISEQYYSKQDIKEEMKYYVLDEFGQENETDTNVVI